MKELVNGSSGQQSDEHKSRFQVLWEQAVANAADIATLTSELDHLVARVESEIVPVEREVGALIRQVLERQLHFSTRKTLRKWQRTELEHRIAELVSELVILDLLDHDLHDRLALRLAVAQGFQLAPDSVLSLAEQLACFFEPDDADADMQWCDKPDLQGSHGSTAQTSPDDSLFKRLFRQAAAALHPDREKDPDRLTQKHELMVQLLKARDERDLITLLQLHERHTDAASELSSADESQLEAVLVEHLDVLQARRESIIYQSYQYFMVYQRFHDSSPAITDSKLACYRESLKDRESPLRHFICEVRTLKDLQQYLSQPDSSSHPGGQFFR